MKIYPHPSLPSGKPILSIKETRIDISVGEPLAKFRLFPSVSGTEEIEEKKGAQWETPRKIPVVPFSWWNNTYYSLILSLKINKKTKRKKMISVEEPLAKFWLFPSVSGTEEIKKRISVGEPLKIFRLFPSVSGTE